MKSLYCINEIKEIENLEKTIFNSSALSFAELKKMYEEERYIIKLCKYEGKVIAYSIVYDSEDVYELIKISVDSDYRNRGIAKRLLEEIKGKEIFLEVRESNYEAISLYKKLDFTQISERKNYYKDNGETAYIMKKD